MLKNVPFLPGLPYPRDAMLAPARVLGIATCLTVCPSVRLSHTGTVSVSTRWRFLHHDSSFLTQNFIPTF